MKPLKAQERAASVKSYEDAGKGWNTKLGIVEHVAAAVQGRLN